MTLKELNDNFIYTPDKQEDWSIPSLVDGKYKDDCDGYMLAIYYKVDDFKDRTKLVWFCTAWGVGHVVTEIDGMIIDNNTKRLVHKNTLPHYTDWRRVYPVEIWFKMAMSKVGLYKLIRMT